MSLNIDKIATVIGYLTLYPDNHRQADWYSFSRGSVKTAKEMRNPSCGTTMCLAGWTAAIFAPDDAIFSRENGVGFELHGRTHSVDRFAANELGITDEVRFWLFYTASNSQIIPALRYLVRHPLASAYELDRATDSR